MNAASPSASSSSASRCMRWRLVGRIWAICGTVSGPSSARLRMKPNAPPPQLVMSPVFWPSARILKKHWATSSISSAIASVLPSTIRPALVLCRADTISIRSGDRISFLLDPIVVNSQNDPLVVVFESDPYCVASGSVGAAMGMDTAVQQINNTGPAGVIARPPLLFLGALLLGFVLDHL